MSPRRRPRTGPAPRGLILLLLMAVGFGLLAALLAGGATTSNPAPSATNTPATDGLLWFQAIGYGAMALFILYVGYQVYLRIAEGRIPLPARFAIMGIVALLIGVAFVVAFDLVHTSMLTGVGAPPPTNGTGSGSSVPSGLNASNNSTAGLRSSSPIPGLPALTWFDLSAIGLGVATAVAIAFLLVARDPAELPAPAPEAAQRLRDELLASLKRLEEDPEADPRAVIAALYQWLLLTLHPRFAGTDRYTAREIEAVIVAQFGVRASNARELTELFEVARYSTHPLGRPAADRARAAFRAILSDLAAVLAPPTEWDPPATPPPPA